MGYLSNLGLFFALATHVQAQSAEDIANYPDFAELFAKWNCTWEPIKAHADDGYILTMFRFTGDVNDGPFNITKPAVVLQHGMGGQGIYWLNTYRPDVNEPLAVQLARDGFDVYLTNNSGVKYSQEHEWMTIYDDEYWLMDWRKYGVFDLPAFVREIQKRNGGKKVAYLGHSQGTTQTYAGMAKIPEWYDANISTAVLMGTCTVVNTKYFDIYTKENWQCLKDIGVVVISGPNWDELRPQVMEKCDSSLTDKLAYYEGFANNPLQTVSAYAQTAFSSRFQEYTADWFDLENPKTELMDFGRVQEMTVTMINGLFDDSCPITKAQAQFEQMGGDSTVVNWVYAPWSGHVPWGFAASPWYVNLLKESLMNNADL